ncbi:myb/SANT-like DNA-binding domain-containing protein 3 [Macrobrachium rosenbergii]|uniref:myb/SANT-like DNA-binding domain-containing protein 3 n=1 Tax=Macrobrachium rosenbergii TaxID=79674 RepID=UPI0034D59190
MKSMLEGVGMPLVYSAGGAGGREQRRPMWTQHEKAVLRLLMRQYAGVTEFDPPDVHKHPIRNEMWRLLTARYNAHPHVRSRDTKQLRKAWENLKYRARKLGAESQRNGRQQNNNTESSWPLDGVTLPGPQSPPPQSTTPTPREVSDVGDWRGSEDETPRNVDEETESEKIVKDEEDDDNAQDTDSVHHSLPLDDRGGGGTGAVPAVLNLHPFVTSLLGGSLGSLASTLPFLASPATSQLATGLLLPHAVSTLSSGDLESGPTILSSSVDSSTTTSSSPTTTVASIFLAPNAAATTSGPCISTTSEAATITINGASPPTAAVGTNTFTTTTSASSTTGTDKAAGTDIPLNTATTTIPPNDRFQHRLHVVETSIRHSEEQHQAQLQLLRLQMAHSVAEHEAKMRVLGAQLEYWQRKLRVQQRVSYALSAITQNDPDLDDEPLP